MTLNHRDKTPRWVGRTLWKIFGLRREAIARAPATRATAELASGVEGSSWVWCSCGELLAPIVYGAEQAEVIALACINGHGAVPVQVGILIEGNARNVHAS